MRLSDERKKLLWGAAKTFRDQFEGSPAEEYLVGHRCLDLETVDHFSLGYVGDSAPSGFEQYRGTIAVPYLRRGALGSWSVMSIRFRCVRSECVKNADGTFREEEVHSGHGKMQSMAGDTHRVYNTLAIQQEAEEIAVCEGEPDTWTAKMCGLPAVGIQGVKGWKSHFDKLFVGYKRVWVLADGDEAGMEFAETVANRLPSGLVVPMGAGLDVNKTYKNHGREAVLNKVGKA
ncbi:toprim domain-containing protein [Streptomyces vinaceus]|uniref:toprim domain-containing protein n=1 Tax=Streptomyces vinaceus TaxID=1960 RepID=UPI0036A69EDD